MEDVPKKVLEHLQRFGATMRPCQLCTGQTWAFVGIMAALVVDSPPEIVLTPLANAPLQRIMKTARIACATCGNVRDIAWPPPPAPDPSSFMRNAARQFTRSP